MRVFRSGRIRLAAVSIMILLSAFLLGTNKACREKEPEIVGPVRAVFEAVQFENVRGGRLEAQYNWVILFGQASGFDVPLPNLPPGKYSLSIQSMNAKPRPIVLQVSNAEDRAGGMAASYLLFGAGDNSLSTQTATIETLVPFRRLRVRFINDMMEPRDRNATVRRVVVAGPES